MPTILLIEDDAAMRAMIATGLRFRGHVVIEAGDGDEGLDRHAQGMGAFDLVVCDLILPTRPGVSVISQIHDRAPNAAVLIISGSERAIGALATLPGSIPRAVLPKPFTMLALELAVDRLIAEYPPRS